MKDLFGENEEYFIIIPNLIINYFANNCLANGRSILDVEAELFEIVKRLEAKTVSEPKNYKLRSHGIRPLNKRVNLFDHEP